MRTITSNPWLYNFLLLSTSIIQTLIPSKNIMNWTIYQSFKYSWEWWVMFAMPTLWRWNFLAEFVLLLEEKYLGREIRTILYKFLLFMKGDLKYTYFLSWYNQKLEKTKYFYFKPTITFTKKSVNRHWN